MQSTNAVRQGDAEVYLPSLCCFLHPYSADARHRNVYLVEHEDGRKLFHATGGRIAWILGTRTADEISAHLPGVSVLCLANHPPVGVESYIRSVLEDGTAVFARDLDEALLIFALHGYAPDA